MNTLLSAAAAALLASLPAAPVAAAPLANPALSNLQIELWPEYDRPQTLVILKAELAPETKLPAEVAVRIPAAAGGPSAAAYADAGGNLINLQYQLVNEGTFVRVRLTTPQRGFHLEYYDPLASKEPSREYRYRWAGDLKAEHVALLVKQPATASNLSVTPALSQTGTGPDGLPYRAGDFGPLKAGEALSVAVSYTKTDSRLTSEVLRESAASTPAVPARKPERQYDSLAFWLLGIGAAGLAAGAAGLLLLRRREPGETATPACRKCGKKVGASDRFCPSCGAALKR